MSDPFSDPHASPRTRDGNPLPPGQGQPQWGPPQGDQQPWGPQPSWGDAPAGQPWGEAYGQPPQPSSNKVVWIVVAVAVVAVLAVLGAAALVLTSFRGGIVQSTAELFDDRPAIPAGPRLLEAEGSVGEHGSQQFEFSVPDRTAVQIDVIGRDGFDPVATLKDGSGRELNRNDDGDETGFDSRIVTDLDPGTYIVDVAGYVATAGAFEVIVTDR